MRAALNRIWRLEEQFPNSSETWGQMRVESPPKLTSETRTNSILNLVLFCNMYTFSAAWNPQNWTHESVAIAFDIWLIQHEVGFESLQFDQMYVLLAVFLLYSRTNNC